MKRALFWIICSVAFLIGIVSANAAVQTSTNPHLAPSTAIRLAAPEISAKQSGTQIAQLRRFRAKKFGRRAFRKHRRWNIRRRRHFGRTVGSIVLGSVIAAAIIGTVPVAPEPDLCWHWASSKHTHGYWYYCAEDDD